MRFVSNLKYLARHILNDNSYLFSSRLNSRYSHTDLQNRPMKNPLEKKRRKHLDDVLLNRVCLTIMGNGAPGQPCCVALFTEFKGYIFNCGEGIGRLCREYEVDFYLMRHFFATQRNWKNLSGIPDIFITNDLKNVRKVSLYGPPGIEYFTSMLTSTIKAKVHKRLAYADENLEITSIPVNSSCLTPFSSKKNIAKDVVYNYVVKIPERPGEFNPEKCVNLGVPLGPHLLKLKQGEDVVLSDGRVIHAADVLDSVQPRTVLLVVDCPSFEFLDSFVSEHEFAEYQLPADQASDVKIVLHYSPPEILKTSTYQGWMHKFHQDTEHYILHTSNGSTSSDAACQSQHVFNVLHPEIFKTWPKEEELNFLPHLAAKIIYPPPMLQLHLRPQKKISRCSVAQYNVTEFTHMLKSSPDFNFELKKLESLTSSSLSEEQKYPEVLFLGTSSATSTAFRNVSGILVNISPEKSILLDCGEATYLQLSRYYGTSINEVLQKIYCVFISHMHTDHYLGLFAFIKAREEAFKKSGRNYEKLNIILPKPIRRIFLRFCDLFENLKPKVRLISCKSLTSEYSEYEGFTDILQEVQIETVPVQHCHEAYGIVLKNSQWKIVFSGDSAPCQKLIDAGENCNLLIHEASIEDGLVNEACMKKHSTPSQVVDIAERMNAEYTILTHFSKRYLSVPILPENTTRPVGCAFDFMKVRLHELQFLPHFLPILKNLFQEDLNTSRENSSSAVSFVNVFVRNYQELRTKCDASTKD